MNLPLSLFTQTPLFLQGLISHGFTIKAKNNLKEQITVTCILNGPAFHHAGKSRFSWSDEGNDYVKRYEQLYMQVYHYPQAGAERRARVLIPLGDLLHPGILTKYCGTQSCPNSKSRTLDVQWS